jgi:hypothetical protein
VLEKEEKNRRISEKSVKVLQIINKKGNFLQTIKRRNADCIGNILHRSCLLKHIIEGKIEGMIGLTGRRGSRLKHLLDDLKERRRHWKLKAEALHCNLWLSCHQQND